ncbi:ATP-binding protein [Halomicrococcus sp. NG-SE-24]|uniref:ATP-binding protein n=1 Tax=Halomicrococcus sp. NG-SE-24 TaxID=3436928 RepID=UPI003D98899F
MNAKLTSASILKTRQIPTLVSGFAVLLTVFFLGELVVFHGAEYVASDDFLVSLLTSGVFVVGVLYGGYWLARSDLPPGRYPRIVKWIGSGAAFSLAINFPMLVIWAYDFPAQVGWVRFTVSVGAAGGLLVGCIEAQAIQREIVAERTAVRAEVVEKERQWLDYLNGLLRHEVLNTTNVITGNASLLLEDDDLPDDARDSLRTIRRQSGDMAKVIQDVRVLIDATQDVTEPEPKNLANVLDAELEKLRSTYESVEVDADLPDDAPVVADDLLPRIYSNLLRNAVEHNDSAPARVNVTAERTADAVVVRIADDGPGIPADERSTLFERSDNTGATHGLGLYLVRTLAERYGGTVELTETGPDGSAFTVELPAAEAGEFDDVSSDARVETSAGAIETQSG